MREKKSILIAVAMLALAALACSVIPSGTEEPTVAPPPTAVPPTAVPPTAPPPPTVPPPPPTAPPVPTTPPTQPSGGVLFRDSFGNLDSGWEIGDYADGNVGYGAGFYYVTSEAAGSMMWGVAYQNFSDLVIDVDATQASAPSNDNNAYGVMCRVQDDNDGYLLRISGDGFYAIHRIVDGDFQALVDWTASDVINQGNDTNHIRAVCDGTHLALIVNGEMLAEIDDSSYSEGDIALTATTFEDEGTEIHFDELVVLAPRGQQGPPPTGGGTLLQDDFSDPNSGWEIGDYAEGNVGYGDGFYYVTAEREGGAMWGLANQDFADVVIDVDATQVSAPPNDNNAYGVKCRVQPGGTGGDGYALMISGDGFYSIQIIQEGDYDALVAWTASDAINQGNATNHIRAVCEETYLALYVNGQLLAEADDATYMSGDISLMAATLEPEMTEVHFDNIVVTTP